MFILIQFCTLNLYQPGTYMSQRSSMIQHTMVLFRIPGHVHIGLGKFNTSGTLDLGVLGFTELTLAEAI